MRSLRYLNTILTVLAILLSLNLWMQWTQTPAAALPITSQAQAAGLPDSGAQLQQQIELLKQLNRTSEELTGLFKNGQARVRTESPANP